MAYLITGATGWIGRYLVPSLLARGDEVHVLVRPGADAAHRFDRFARGWAGGDRLHAVRGDLSRPGLGIDPEWVRRHSDSIGHIFHLAGGFDTTCAGAGTRQVVEFAAEVNAGVLHHISTVEVAGAAEGLFAEDMFDIGQRLPTAEQRAAVEAERMVRDGCAVGWRIYRPSIVIGHSRTGDVDRLAGPYAVFRLLRMAAQLPRLLPILVPKLGETNVVPVDFVARAIDHIAHRPGGDGTTYHLVDPRRQGTVDVLNLFAEQAGSPHLLEVMPKQSLEALRGVPGVGRLVAALGVPQDILDSTEFGCWFDCRNTTAALAGTDIRVPPLAAYAPILWKHWVENCV
ncbi:SDR family oxidoreductase [Nocardia spumae]|uniref:SDR family oxidoreductase n=1 Tax=Nocardia spumae TaxID=2887190 RepID=UPI001D15886B|nr:SDR family oxidoreductase [Nocardia spumae]